jgi:VCBS repeat-containing protein
LEHTASKSDNFSVHDVPFSRTSADVDVHHRPDNGQHANGITLPDAGLLFSGDYKRSGEDLVISGSGQKFTIGNYFRGEHHRALFSPDGASLSGDVVDALTGYTTYAQADPGTNSGQPIGHVVKLTGSASVIRNGVSVILNIGDNVFKGDVVQSGADSALGISFIDGTAFSLSSNARMVLNAMVYDPNGSSNSSLLSLVQGTITFVAGETAKHGNMKVDTPVATMGIRGTAVLVEISADNGPTKFSVLVEPGQVTGSFVLYDRLTGATLGSISQAGMMTLVTPSGQNQFTISQQLKTQADLEAEKDIVRLVFSIAFPQFNLDDSNPHTTASIGSGVTPFANGGFYPLDTTVVLPQFTKLSDTTKSTATSTVPEDIVFLQHQAQIAVTNVSTFQTGGVEDTQSSTPGAKSFAIAPHVTIFDPVTTDVMVPFVAGSARIVGATGPASIPAGFNLLSLVSVDPTTGIVTYDPSNFRFLGINETAQYVIVFESQVGDSIVPETLLFTVNGLDDAPVFSTSDAQISLNEINGKTGSSDPVTQVALLNFQDPDFSKVGSSYSASVLHTAVTGVTTGLPHAPAALDAILRSYLTPSVLKNLGSTNGVLIETFSAPEKAFDYLAAGEKVSLSYSIQLKDAAGATTGTATVTVIITGVNHAPALAADTVAFHPVIEQPSGAPSEIILDTASGALAFTDVVLSDTHTATAALASEVVSNGTLPAGLLAALQGAIAVGIASDSTGNGAGAVSWNFSAPDQLFDFLRAGQTLTLTYDITLNDYNGGIANGLSATRPVTIVLTGTNNIPQITGETNPSLVVVRALHSTPEILSPGTNTNSLGLHTDTFDALPAGSASDNGAGFGTFYSQALDANFSTTSGHAGIVNGGSDVSAAPFMGPLPGAPDTTNYLSVNGTETIVFNEIQNTFGLYWSSVDAYNTIEFFHGATLVASFTGVDLSPLVANGNENSFASAGYVQFSNLSAFDTVVLQSGQAFEVDNMSAGFVPPPTGEQLAPITGTLTATDAHIGDTLTASVTGNGTIEYNSSTNLPANVDVSSLIAAHAVSFDSVTTNGGPEVLHWTYNPGAAVDFLKPGDTLTITFIAQVNDGSGDFGSQPVTVTIRGDSGALTIADGAGLELGSWAESGVTFEGSTGGLTLDNPSTYHGLISGFIGNGTLAGSDQIDLKGINYHSGSFSESYNSAAGTLSVSDGTNSATLHFNGAYSSANFSFLSDGSNGTIVYDPPASSRPDVIANGAQTPGTATNTTIVASVPNETLTGNGNGNAFVFNFAGVGHDTVSNFHPEIDTLLFSSALFATTQAILDATHDDGHGNAVIALDTHDTITMAGVLKANLSAVDFHLV